MATVKSSSPYALKIQGVRFSIVDGIIFSGVELSTQKGPILFHAENVLLRLSLWKALRGEDPLHEVFIPSGSLYPVRIHRERKAITGGSSLPLDLIKNRNIRITQLELILPGEARFVRPVARLLIEPGDAQARLSGDITSRLEGENGLIEFHGNFMYGARSRFFFIFKEIGSRLTRYGLKTSPLFSDDFRTFSRFIRLEHDPIGGKGSFDYEGGKLAINLEGEFQKLNFQFFRRDRLAVAASDQKGTFRYNAGFSSIQEIADFFDFQLAAQDIGSQVRYRSPALAGGHEYRLELTLREAAEIVLGGLPARGRLNMSSAISYKKREEITPQLDVTIEYLQTDLSSLYPGEHSQLELKGFIKQSDGEMRANLDGAFLGFPLSARGTGKVTFDPVRLDDTPLHALWQKHKWQIKLEDIAYDRLVSFAGAVVSGIYTAAHARNARRAEDSGPLWRTSFTDRRIYQLYLKYLTFDGELEMKAKPGSSFPETIMADFGKTQASYQFNIPTARGNDGSIYLRYYGTFDATMPRHDLRLELNLGKNTYELPGTALRPASVNLNYHVSGSGWYPYDLVFWTHSTMTLTMRDVDLSSLGPARIVLYSIGQPQRKAQASFVSISRRTQAGYIDFTNIRVEAPSFEADGSASFESDLHGKMKLRYTYDENGNKKRDTVEMRTTEQGRWIPDE